MESRLKAEQDRVCELEAQLSEYSGQLNHEKVQREQLEARVRATTKQSVKENELNRNLALSVTEMRKNHEAREKLFKQRMDDAKAKLVQSERKASDAVRKSTEMEQRLLQLKRDFAVDRELLNLAGARGARDGDVLSAETRAGLTAEQKERCRQQ